MDQLIQLINSPLFKYLVYYWVFSAVVSALPSTAIVSTKVKFKPFVTAYSYLFTFLHIVAGSLARIAVAFKLPGVGEPEPPPTT